MSRYEVIVSGSDIMMEAWVTAWSKSGNSAPVRFFNDGKWSEKTKAFCSKFGTVEDAESIYSYARKVLGGSTEHKVGWLCKLLIMAQAKTEYAVWLDHDAEIQNDLSPIVDYVVKSGAWFGSPYYSSFTKKYADKRLCQHGIIVYKPKDARMQKWIDSAIKTKNPNDEENFVTAFGGIKKSAIDTCDIYRKGWYETPDSEDFKHLRDTIPRLSKSNAVVVHWASGVLKWPMREHVLGSSRNASDGKLGGIVGSLRGEGIDAVFVLGTGSKHNNEELRYALRSMAKFCPWIRKVWVVGNDPGFLSKEVSYVECKDIYTHSKDANIIYKVHTACKQDGLTSRFLMCSDDQLVTKPSTWEDFEPRWLGVYSTSRSNAFLDSGNWKKNLEKTLKRFGNGAKYFQPHIWAQFEKEKFLAMCKEVDYAKSSDVIIMSLYFNWTKTVGIENFDHVFGKISEVRHVAYSDIHFGDTVFRKSLKDRFPSPCRYEREYLEPKFESIETSFVPEKQERQSRHFGHNKLINDPTEEELNDIRVQEELEKAEQERVRTETEAKELERAIAMATINAGILASMVR